MPGRCVAARRQQMWLPSVRKLRPPCQASCCTAGGTAGLNALAILPDFRSGDVRRSGSQYSQADRWREGFGSVLGRAALLKSADLRLDAAAADSVLNEVVVYQRLQRLQGRDVAVLEAAGMSDQEVFLAVSGVERPERPSSRARLLRRPRDPRDMLPVAKRAALDALRRIHDAGRLHCKATSRSLLLRRRQVSHVAEPRGPLLWADFGDSRIVWAQQGLCCGTGRSLHGCTEPERAHVAVPQPAAAGGDAVSGRGVSGMRRGATSGAAHSGAAASL